MPHIDFDAARRERQRNRDPLTFTLGDQEFKCHDVLTLSDLWDPTPEVIEAPEHVKAGATTPTAHTFMMIALDIARLLHPSEVDRWWSIFDPKNAELIEPEDLLNVLNKLSEHYTGRPTSPSDDSSNGQQSTDGGSTSNSEPDAKD